MNLGRAKVMLIIAFAGLNIFLAYHLFWPAFGKMTRVAVSTEDLLNLELFLEENNYRLLTGLERSTQTADFLTVSTSKVFQRTLILKMLEEGAELSHTEDGTFCNCNGRSIMIQPTGLIRVVYKPPEMIEQASGEQERLEESKAVEQFLADRYPGLSGLTYDYTATGDAADHVLNYYQVIGEKPVFAGSIKVYLKEGSVQAAEIYWLDEVAGSQSKEMEVISAAEAIKSMVRGLGPAGTEQLITEVKLGHFSVEYDAEKWEIPPVWRIVLQNDQIYYINAFTGNFERKNAILEQLSRQDKHKEKQDT